MVQPDPSTTENLKVRIANWHFHREPKLSDLESFVIRLIPSEIEFIFLFHTKGYNMHD